MANAIEKSLFSTSNWTVVTLLFEETTSHSRLLAYKIWCCWRAVAYLFNHCIVVYTNYKTSFRPFSTIHKVTLSQLGMQLRHMALNISITRIQLYGYYCLGMAVTRYSPWSSKSSTQCYCGGTIMAYSTNFLVDLPIPPGCTGSVTLKRQ